MCEVVVDRIQKYFGEEKSNQILIQKLKEFYYHGINSNSELSLDGFDEVEKNRSSLGILGNGWHLAPGCE